MNKLIKYCCLILCTCFFLNSCGVNKRISKGNYAFEYVNNLSKRVNDPSADDKFNVYEIKTPFKSKIDDKTDYLVIKNDSIVKSYAPIYSIAIHPSKPEKIQMNGVLYSSESSLTEFDEFQRPFTYSDWKLALQTLTIPIKYRNALDDEIKYPSQVESGINIGLAPVIKYNINAFNPNKKPLGKSLNQYSINTGIILNLGTTALDTASTAPGLESNRKSALFTVGTFVMFGINNINFGYAIGWDYVIGEGHSCWVYQNKVWHGIIIALDIIKP